MKEWNHEFRANLPQKGLKWYKGFAMLEKDEQNTVHFFGKITDISSFKLQELQLKISEQRFSFALEASSEGIWDLDVKANTVFIHHSL